LKSITAAIIKCFC